MMLICYNLLEKQRALIRTYVPLVMKKRVTIAVVLLIRLVLHVLLGLLLNIPVLLDLLGVLVLHDNLVPHLQMFALLKVSPKLNFNPNNNLLLALNTLVRQ